MKPSIDALITLVFEVRDPIATNHGYGLYFGAIAKGRKPMYLTSAGARFKAAIEQAALAARSQSDWPTDPLRVARARISLEYRNYRGDTDGPRKFVRDSLEGILWDNDRDVCDGPGEFSEDDDGPRRIIITPELLTVRNALETQRLREQRLQARITRSVKKPRRASSALDGLPAHMRALVSAALEKSKR